MKHIPILFVITLLLATIPATAQTGYRTTTLAVAHRTQPLELHIWYPATEDGTPQSIGKNAVFVGVDVAINASVVDAPHPLVLLSHGSGGNAVNIAWIASYLAKQGMVVIATNHPGTTSRDSIPQETVKIWQRPDDLSAILDHVEQSLIKEFHIDMTRVGVVGFSLGGHTALSIVGAQADQNAYVSYCEQYAAFLDCAWFRSAGVDLRAIDTDMFEQNNSDPRIKASVAIDPALAQAYQAASLAKISVPVQIINLGTPETVPMGINASKASRHLPNVEFNNVTGATHFSFLGLCTEIGEMIISGEGEEPICTETGDRSRHSIHEELKALIGGFLIKML